MKTIEIEIALMSFLDVRRNIIVPNVWWRFLHYEADLVVLTKSGYSTEIEIKVSKADLKKDKEKNHNHDSDYFKYLYFAVPRGLTEFALTEIPENAGLYEIWEKETKTGYWVNQVKSPLYNKNCKKWNIDERMELAELGCMRIVGLKKKILKYEQEKL